MGGVSVQLQNTGRHSVSSQSTYPNLKLQEVQLSIIKIPNCFYTSKENYNYENKEL